MLIKIENELPVGNPIVEDNFKQLFPEVVFPLILTNELVNPYGYAMYDFSQIPTCGPLQKVIEVAPLKNEFNNWYQQWQVVDLAGVELAAKEIEIEETRIKNLWFSATMVERDKISGSAIGLITIGVIQNKPKCLAMHAWIKTLWTEYYLRKGNGSVDYDFSAFSSAPHTVPELMTELES